MTAEHDGKPAFAYLLSWKDEAEMKAGWASFMADAEWKEIKSQRATDAPTIVGDITDLALHRAAFSRALF